MTIELTLQNMIFSEGSLDCSPDHLRVAQHQQQRNTAVSAILNACICYIYIYT